MPNARERIATSLPMRPKPDDADGLFQQFVAGLALPIRLASPLRVESVWNRKFFSSASSSMKVVLGHGGVIHAGREEQRDAEFGAGLHVNLVHADAVFAQDLQLRARLFQNLARDGVVAADVAVHVADERERVRLVQRAARGDDFPAGFASSKS